MSHARGGRGGANGAGGRGGGARGGHSHQRGRGGYQQHHPHAYASSHAAHASAQVHAASSHPSSASSSVVAGNDDADAIDDAGLDSLQLNAHSSLLDAILPSPHAQRLFDFLLSPLPGTDTESTLTPPFSTNTVRTLMQRVERWCQDQVQEDAEWKKRQLLFALVSPRGSHILHAAFEGVEPARVVSMVLLPLSRIFMQEPTRTKLMGEDSTASALTSLFQHALWSESAARLRLLCDCLRRHCQTAAAGAAGVQPGMLDASDLESLIHVCVLGLSGVSVVSQGSAADLDDWLRTIGALMLPNLQVAEDLRVQLQSIHASLSARQDAVLSGSFDRHDNDRADFGDIRLLPSPAELLCESAPFLPRIDEPGLLFTPSDDNQALDDSLSIPAKIHAAWLGRCFRLLREDMVAPLREEIRLLRAYWMPSSNAIAKHKAAKIAAAQQQRLLRRTYDGVAFRAVETRGLYANWFFRVRFQQPPEALKLEGASRARYWQDRPTLLPRGALVCFVQHDSGEPVRFGVVEHRDDVWLANVRPASDDAKSAEANGADDSGSFSGHDAADPHAAFIGVRISGEADTLATLRELRTSGVGALRMVAVQASFFAYAPMLRRLQTMHTVAFPELLSTRHTPSPADSVEFPGEAGLLQRKLAELERAVTNGDDLRELLQCPNAAEPVHIDEHQLAAVRACLTTRLPLTQGPPGTGKTLVGAVTTRFLLLYTDVTVIAVTHSNHAVDDLLRKLQLVGVARRDMVRMGGSKKIDASLQDVTLRHLARQPENRVFIPAPEFARKKELGQTVRELAAAVPRALATWRRAEGHSYETVKALWMQAHPNDLHQWTASFEPSGGWQTVGQNGTILTPQLVWKQWREGSQQPAGLLVAADQSTLWSLPPADRLQLVEKLCAAPRQHALRQLHELLLQLDQQQQLRTQYTDRPQQLHVLRSRRLVACTSSGAAIQREVLDALRQPHVLLAEECCELLEPHLLAACNSHTLSVVQIGDHKQLRPRVNVVGLQHQSGLGLDLNTSLMERMIKSGFPVQRLQVQHRMHPQIADMVRGLGTYERLDDAAHVADHPPIRGLQTSSRVLFIDVSSSETAGHFEVANGAAGASSASSSSSSVQASVQVQQMSLDSVSKCNAVEAILVSNIVAYLLKQGYARRSITVLSPYLGQLRLLRDELAKRLSGGESVKSDWHDSKQLAHAGGDDAPLGSNSADSIDVRSIDNYQGEENDVIIVSLVRSNTRREIGFLREAERVNVLLSRARHGLILVGEQDTLSSGKGQPTIPGSKFTMWSKIIHMLESTGNVHPGLPVRCAQHGTERILLQSSDFAACPDGGCAEVCGALLPCMHECTKRCHSSYVLHAPCKQTQEQLCVNGKHKEAVPCRIGLPLARCVKCQEDEKAAAHAAHAASAAAAVAAAASSSPAKPAVGKAPSASSGGGCLMQQVSLNSVVGLQVHRDFHESCAHGDVTQSYAARGLTFNIESIYSINNPPLAARFEQARASLTICGRPTDEVIAYHGTLEAKALSIAQHNFQPQAQEKKLDSGWFGAGFYFSPHADYTYMYAAPRVAGAKSLVDNVKEGVRLRLLRVRVLPGRQKQVASLTVGATQPPGFDSVISPASFELVMYSAHHCLPEFIIDVRVQQAKGKGFAQSIECLGHKAKH